MYLKYNNTLYNLNNALTINHTNGRLEIFWARGTTDRLENIPSSVIGIIKRKAGRRVALFDLDEWISQGTSNEY